MLKRAFLLAVPLAALLAAALITVAPSPAARAGSLPPIGGSVANFSRIDPPLPAPGEAFKDGSGKTLSLADFRGKLVLLNLWATWCAPCRAEMPSLDRLQATLGGEGLAVLPLSLDRGGGPVVALFYGRQEISHLGVYVAGTGGGLPGALQIGGLPTSFLIDREGRIVGRLEGATQWDSPEALELIRFYLAEGKTPEKPLVQPASLPNPAGAAPEAARAEAQRVGVGFSPL